MNYHTKKKQGRKNNRKTYSETGIPLLSIRRPARAYRAADQKALTREAPAPGLPALP